MFLSILEIEINYVDFSANSTAGPGGIQWITNGTGELNGKIHFVGRFAPHAIDCVWDLQRGSWEGTSTVRLRVHQVTGV
jgi:hypothetical protein